jgi:hypothetical protein
MPGLFRELSLRCERIFAGSDQPFRERPHAEIFLAPERAPRVAKKNLQIFARLAEEKNTGTQARSMRARGRLRRLCRVQPGQRLP